MATLVYVHGFLSSPESHKAMLTRQWLLDNRPSVHYCCPYLSPYPEETKAQLHSLMSSLKGESVGFIGSSLGGFWSTWLVENYGHKAVLVNPSVRPHELIDRVAGEPQKNFYTEDSYVMTAEHGNQYRHAYQPQLKDLTAYWLMVQTGDETLDYRQAVERYQGGRQLIIDGGDHGFQGFERQLTDILSFLFEE
ncbi:MAG: YqiA/YcfP family alpha/beta fold hydrolase [Cellvibrionaceae bacterium]